MGGSQTPFIRIPRLIVPTKVFMYVTSGGTQYELHVMNMSETTSKVNLFGLIGFIGTIILIVGVFLNWVTLDYNVIITKGSESVTGWTLLHDADYKEVFDYVYAPLVALVCGVISLITTLLPIVYKNEKVTRILGIVTLILAVVAIVIGFMFYGSVGDSVEILGMSAYVGVDIGFWL